LANGLQVIVLPSRRAPIVTQVMIYKVGAADEVVGRTGIAHFLEHMMFKGTATLGPGEFSKIVARNGGRENAFTDFDVTGYHQTIAADRLEMVMRMEADRMSNLRIVEKELTPERQVVLEERRMRIENVPSSLLDEAVRERLFGEHKPYGMPVIGYVDDVKKLTPADLTTFYKKHYAPNNAVLIVAGDTSPDSVRKLAERYYGPLAKKPIEARRRPSSGGTDLPQKVVRADARVVEARWGRDYLAPSYRTGETRHAYALSVLARLLGGSETSRLWRALVSEQKVVLSASADYAASSLGLTTFGLDAHPARGYSLTEVESAIADQIKKLLDDGVTSEEVERAQNRLLAQAIYAQDSLSSGPRIYGAALSTGGSVADVDDWPRRIAAVTPADVVAAARHVFRDDGAVTSVLTPVEAAK
jgi:zinc protease